MKERNDTIKLVGAFAAIYIIWGSTYLAIRFAIETLPPFLMAGIRFSIAGMLLYLFSRRKSSSPVKAVHWKSSFIAGAFLILGGNGGVVWAEQYVPSGLAAVLIATEPLWIVILTWVIIKGDKPGLKTILGVLLGFAGLVFLVNPFGQSIQASNIPGIIAVLLASLSWAAGTIYTRYAKQTESKITAAAMQMLSGGFLLILAGVITGELSEINIQGISVKSLAAFLYLIFVGSIVAFTSYIYLIGAAGPSRASTYAYVNPVIAVFLGWLMAGEIIDLRIILSTAVIIISVALINTNIGRARSYNKWFNKERSQRQ